MEFERVGGKDRIKVNARIIAATNRNLKTLVREGKFRDDLYYRLNIILIKIPPLRERKEDISPLVEYLLNKINQDLHKRIVGVSDNVMDIFLKYHWPGNIRELENLLVRAAVVAQGRTLERENFPDIIEDVKSKGMKEEIEEDGLADSGRFLTLDEVEELQIRKVVRNSEKNKGEICEILGISRPTFERKLEKYGITFERN